MALNILVVDDSAVMRSMITKTLRLSNLPIGDVYEACNGEEGLQVIEQQWIDLLLLDIHMPVMSGDEMIERLRNKRETADLAVIVVSSDTSDARIEAVNKMGIGFIPKPFTPETLREVVTSLLGEFETCTESMS